MNTITKVMKMEQTDRALATVAVILVLEQEVMALPELIALVTTNPNKK